MTIDQQLRSLSEGEECQTRAICMQAYDFDVVQRAGATNANTDSLSRYRLSTNEFVAGEGGRNVKGATPDHELQRPREEKQIMGCSKRLDLRSLASRATAIQQSAIPHSPRSSRPCQA